MSFAQAVGSALRQYATFSGRARRSEYWWFYLFTVLAGIGASVVDSVLGSALGRDVEIVNVLVSLALLVPSIAVGARRLHDTGRTGWWLLLPVVPAVLMAMLAIPAMILGFLAAVDGQGDLFGGVTVVAFFLSIALMLVGGIVLVVFLCLDSQPGPNKYGLSPKHPMPGGGGYGPPWPGAYPPPGTYPPPPGGYLPPQPGGYGPPPHGSYGPPPHGGYGSPQPGGYVPPQPGGYPPER